MKKSIRNEGVTESFNFFVFILFIFIYTFNKSFKSFSSRVVKHEISVGFVAEVVLFMFLAHIYYLKYHIIL